MEEIILMTKDGGYVVHVLIPEMKPRPEVIQWGERIFVKKENHSGGTFTEGYYEGLVVVPDSIFWKE